MSHDRAPSAFPYGPATPAIRRFLVRLAALGASEREAVLSRHAQTSGTRRWQEAERALATMMERSGRSSEQEAVSGPLLQLLHRPDMVLPPAEATTDEVLETLDPLAEPSLAALLALIVRDLLDAGDFDTLYAPMSVAIPLDTLDA